MTRTPTCTLSHRTDRTLNELACTLIRPSASRAEILTLLWPSGLAAKFTSWEPGRTSCWNTLGVAYYRQGDWSAADVSIHKVDRARQRRRCHGLGSSSPQRFNGRAMWNTLAAAFDRASGLGIACAMPS